MEAAAYKAEQFLRRSAWLCVGGRFEWVEEIVLLIVEVMEKIVVRCVFRKYLMNKPSAIADKLLKS